MSGFAQGRTPGARKPSLRSMLFEAACDAATEAEVDAAIEAALAKYDDDPEPPMISFIESLNDKPPDCESCSVCLMLNAKFGPAELVPLPDGTILEIRRPRSN